MRATKPLRGAVKARTRSHPSPALSATAESPAGVHLAAAATLAATFALTAAAAAFGAVLLFVSHGETLEAIWWLAGFGVVTPLSILGTAWLLRAADTPDARSALTAAAPWALLSLCGTL